jgi:hypothetical protein
MGCTWGEGVVSWLAENWLNLVGVALSVAGLVLTWWLSRHYYRRGAVVRRTSYQAQSLTVISSNVTGIPGLTVRYSGHGEPVDNFTVSRFLFWNAGTEPIRKQDVPATAPLAIVAKGGTKILEWGIVKQNNTANGWDIQRNQDKTRLRVSFEFLDPKDGIQLFILHTGTGQDDLTMEGNIVGAGAPAPVPFRWEWPVELSLLTKKKLVIMLAVIAATSGVDWWMSGRIPIIGSMAFGWVSGQLHAVWAAQRRRKKEIHPDFKMTF